jgi:hypothetical protein
MPVATMAMVGLVGDGHDFGSGLVWEKESEEGNAFRSLERGVEDQGRQMAVRRSMVAMASKRTCGKVGERGKTGW